jgi:DNA primase
MPLLDFRQARADIRLAEVLQLLGWRARARCGAQVRGPCPVHGSTSPGSRSFSAHLERNIWRCFTCNASGNALDLWARATNQELYPALLALYQQLGRIVPFLETISPLSASNRRKRKDES